MAVFSRLLSTDVKNLLAEKYSKIKTQSIGFKHKGDLVKTYTFTFVDESEKFELERFINKLWLILTHFRINFAVGYILRNEDDLRYFHPSINNSCLLQRPFNVSGSNDLMHFKFEFVPENWLELNSHLNLRPNSKSVVEYLTSITFYVYLVAGIYQFVGSPPNTMLNFFKESMSLLLW